MVNVARVYKRNRKWWSSGVPGCETNPWKYRRYLDYAVYRKPTHTDRYLNFRSDHPLQHKKAVIKTLLCRAERLTASEANYKEEINRVQLALKNNGYPSALTTPSPISKNAKKTTANRSWVVLPYYRGLSEKLQRCLSDYKIKAFF